MDEIRIGTIGNVDSGKTSSISVLINNILDNGRGSARSVILKHPHEKDSGRTSSITENYLKISNTNKYISFIDLAGHEKYLKTTIHGLAGQYIDYTLIFVGANMGVSVMTKEHLILSITLKKPFMFVVTKIDLAPDNILEKTIEDIKMLVKRMNIRQSKAIIMNSDINYNNIDMITMFPIFYTSNKDGRGIDNLRNFITKLPSKYIWNQSTETKFSINHKYNVKGIGTVFSGKLVSGTIKKNDKLLLGPFYGKWINVVAKSLHDNFKNNVERLIAGESGCIAVNSKTDFSKSKIRRGVILVNKDNTDNASRYFDADIAILTRHSTTIKRGYSPIINCNMISQMARIVDIYDERDFIRCGDKAKVKFKFSFRPENVEKGDRIIFRDGRTKGFGQITQIY